MPKSWLGHTVTGQGMPDCHTGCVIRCSNVFILPDDRTLGKIEYETAWGFESNAEINSLDVVGELNYICNDAGLDNIEAGATLGVLMEVGVIPFGYGKVAVEAFKEVAKGTPLGWVIGSGTIFAGKLCDVTRIPADKGQAITAYDPRSCRGNGVTYATTSMGADHTAGTQLPRTSSEWAVSLT